MRSFFCIIIMLGVLISPSVGQISESRQVNNVTAFAKLYGYVKYFHPSDEAAALDWDKFAVYGSSRTLAANTDEELIQILQDLFYPVAPTIKIFNSAEKPVFDIKDITPPDVKNYKPIAWQHLGVGLGNDKFIYGNKRTNRPGPDDKRFADFNTVPASGEKIERTIQPGISVIVPLVLYGSSNSTWPSADKARLAVLQQQLLAEKDSTGNNLTVRLADIVICWNVFKHFFPYWEDASRNAEDLLRDALEKSIADKSDRDFLRTLRLMTSSLNDGHIGVVLATDTGRFFTPPLLLDWVEDNLVVDKLPDTSLNDKLARGDIIVSIDSIDAATYVKNAEKYMSGSPQLKRKKVVLQLLTGYRNSPVTMTVKRKNILTTSVFFRSVTVAVLYRELQNRRKSGFINENVFYLDLDKWPMDSIKHHEKDLQRAKAIICDLRGYPNNNHTLIEYLLTGKEDTKWMFIPKIIYPEYEKVDFQEAGWHMKPGNIHLNAKIVFITDGRAISYAESYMGFIKDFKLATIVGQPTAGTNGNINQLALPGGYHLTFTGMLVKNHNGTKHHLKGIVPDVPIERTIKGVSEGRDELMEKAIELAEKQ